jgi:alkanesulfonate monooxygenase SsuD/methylene tetrahydromethanopterin reductase-like flavin-dependent oxidoreductase (luciferase family)
MNETPVSFGWVTTPTQSVQGMSAEQAATTAAALVGANRAFVEALPPAFTRLWFEDHFQWGADPTLEALTTATFFAALYPRFHIGTLVLGLRYRSPALLAKMAANIHLLSGGRLILGLGAGWKQDEHEAYGFGYPRVGARIEQLEEAVQLIETMLTQSPATFTGSHYAIRDAYCEPRPATPIPIMIGGNGEKTLRVAAAHAALWNASFLTLEALAEKKEVLARHCRDLGRDPREVQITYFSEIDLSGGPSRAPRPEVHFLEGGVAQATAEMQAFIDLGVRHFMLRFSDYPSTQGLQCFVDEVLPRLQQGTKDA